MSNLHLVVTAALTDELIAGVNILGTSMMLRILGKGLSAFIFDV